MKKTKTAAAPETAAAPAVKSEITIASSVVSGGYAFNFGKAHYASENAIAAQAAVFSELGIKPEWVPTEKYTEGNVIHVAVFEEVAKGYADGNARLTEMLKLTKPERAKLGDDEKTTLEKARRAVRRLVMVFLVQVAYVLRGNAPQGASGKGGKGDRNKWSVEQRVMGGLMAIHDVLSGTEKEPATQFWIDLQKLIKPAIAELSSQHVEAKAITSGFGQKYAGSFSVKEKK